MLARPMFPPRLRTVAAIVPATLLFMTQEVTPPRPHEEALRRREAEILARLAHHRRQADDPETDFTGGFRQDLIRRHELELRAIRRELGPASP